MTNESVPSPACACASNPVARALAQAALASLSAENFQDELNWRIGRAKNAADHLAFIFDQADHYRIDLGFDQLHGVAYLLAAELQTIQYLHDALHKFLNDRMKRTGEVAP
ncbi:MAG: hypothetical protein JNK95_08225 [Candidatus Competibacter sp.]|nr:hypothetical protein [Candidatus Competibacter sp.]MDG4607251.1 hypothetical protein [Candidatus Contendobacter sp.]HRD48709.1 hypothetical protein [Candidatus Contendobacter sp.]